MDIWFFVAVHTMDELKMTGNHLKGSRPILSFDSNFDSEPHLRVLKEIFLQVLLLALPLLLPAAMPMAQLAATRWLTRALWAIEDAWDGEELSIRNSECLWGGFFMRSCFRCRSSAPRTIIRRASRSWTTCSTCPWPTGGYGSAITR
jgi:hypothetical protein